MNRLESELKRKLVVQAKALGAYATRIEDRFRVGLLDSVFKFPDLPWVWVEGKITVGDQKFGPTERQWREGLKIVEAGGLAAIVSWDKKTKAMCVTNWVLEAWPSECFDASEMSYGEGLRTWLQWMKEKL